MTAFRAGAGRAAIAYPASVWPLDGFTGEHDPLLARVVVFDGSQRAVWAVLDQTSLASEPLARVREVLAGVAGVPEAQVLVSASHTFSAPHLADVHGIDDADLAERVRLARLAVLAAVADAAHQAVATLRPATVGVATGACDINVNRDVRTPAGWTLGVGEDGYSDKTLTVVRVDAATGEPIAVLVNHAVQPAVLHESSLSDGSRLATSDLAGVALRHIEDATGAVACFVIGAAGDQAPALAAVRTLPSGERADAGEGGFLLAEMLGERLAAASLRLLAATHPADSAPVVLETATLSVPGQVPTLRQDIRPTLSHDYQPDGVHDLPYWLLALGSLAVVGVQVELSAITGRQLRELSPFADTIVATMVNGGAKYLPDADAFDRFTYEALSSRYAKGSAETLTAAVSAQLARLAATRMQGASDD